MSDLSLVRIEAEERFVVLTLNRPEKRNAVSLQMAAEIRSTLRRLERYSVVVITGEGPAFCAGVDLSERRNAAGFTEVLGAADGQYWADTVDAMRRHPAVFIAAVNGFALGGGVTLVNNAELAIASTAAQFGMPELGFGAYPALAGPTTAKRILPKHLFEMAVTTTRIDADKALKWGLVNEVVAPEQLLTRARELAGEISGRDPVALAYTKRALRAAIELGWSDGIEHGAMTAGLIRATRGLLAEGELNEAKVGS